MNVSPETTAPAGWYADPERPGHVRWWDGVRWGATAPATAAPAAAAPAPGADAWRSTAPLARFTVVALAIYGILEVFHLVAGLDRLALVSRIEEGAASLERASFSDLWFLGADLAVVGALLLTGVAFILFFRRAYRNLPAFGATTDHKPGWAVWGWLVPFISLVRPKQIANEIWQKSGPRDGSGAKSPPLLSWWWAAFLIQGFFAQAVGRFTPDGSDPGALRAEALLTMASAVTALVGLVLAWRVVVLLRDRQEERAAARRFRPPVDVAPSRPLLPVAVVTAGLLLGAVAASAEPRAMDPDEGRVATGDAAPTAGEVEGPDAAAMEAACASFADQFDTLPEPANLADVATYFDRAFTLLDERDAALGAAAPASPDAAGAYEARFLGPVRADTQTTKAAFTPVIDSARAGDGDRTDQLLEAVPDSLGAVASAEAYANEVGAPSCAAVFGPVEEPPTD